MRRWWAGHGHRLRAPVLTTSEPYARVDLVRFAGPVDPDDPDAGFKHDLAIYAHAEPMVTLGNLAANLGVPVGVLVHHVLARWAAAGSEAVLEAGPSTVLELADLAAAAEAEGSDEARLEAFGRLRDRLSWLRIPLDDPATVFDPVDEATRG